MQNYRMMIRRTGGPEVIERETIETPSAAPDEVVVRTRAIGLNFIDTYQRSGLYPIVLPSGLGTESAGVIEAIGSDVTNFKVGDRVGIISGPLGAYATVRALPADLLVPLPDTIGFETAAAILFKGLTVDMLAGECGKVVSGQTILVHAASGGVGSLLVAWLTALGAKVIAHAGSASKASRARENGAAVALSCPFDQLAQQVREATGGLGVATVFDGVGKASWEASLASLARRGLMVSFGNASGAPPVLEPLALARAGSLFLTRPTVFDYIETPERRRAAAKRLFARVADRAITAEIGQRFALADAAEAHRALEARATTGSTILIPE